MIDFLLVLGVIGSTIFVLTRYFLEKQKKAALEELYKEYYLILDKFNALPRELKEILIDLYKRLRHSVGEIELKYKDYKSSSDVFEYAKLKKAQGKEFERQIIDNKKKWEIFDTFMSDVGLTKLNIENLQKDIKRKSQDIMISLGEKNQDELDKDKIIQEQTEKVVRDLDVVYREYDKLQGNSFLNFDIQKLNDVEKLRDISVKDAEYYYDLLKYYNKEIEIVLMGISRKSTFFIKLKELLEGYQSGKNKMANLGEVSVSFKTFEKLEEGSRYRQDVFVSSKRVHQEIEADFYISSGKSEFHHTEKLSYDELIDLLNLCKLKPSDEEIDENKVPYNFEITDMDITLGKKEKQELLIKYAKDLNVLMRIPIRN